MRIGVLRFDVVHVVGHDHRHIVLRGELEELPVNLRQLGYVVFLELDIPPLRPKDIAVPVQPLHGFLDLTGLDERGQLSRQAAGGADQPFAVRGQVVGVDARLIVVAVKLRIRADLEQVVIAGHVLGQQQQVVAALVLVGRHAPSWTGRTG